MLHLVTEIYGLLLHIFTKSLMEIDSVESWKPRQKKVRSPKVSRLQRKVPAGRLMFQEQTNLPLKRSPLIVCWPFWLSKQDRLSEFLVPDLTGKTKYSKIFLRWLCASYEPKNFRALLLGITTAILWGKWLLLSQLYKWRKWKSNRSHIT